MANPSTPTFADVPPDSPFYTYIETAVRRNVIGGYYCGGEGEPRDPQSRPYFRPNANITRGQLAKVIALARDWSGPMPPTLTFSDVPASNTFYEYIESVVRYGIVGGYSCGGVGEPCDPQNRPYFRPSNSATRGQVAKIVALAFGGP